LNPSKIPKSEEQEPGLATKATRGSIWFGFGRYISYIINFASGIILARLLAPEDFGVVALATASFGILSRLNSLGIGTMIIQREDDDPIVLSTFFWIQASVAVTILLLAIVFALSSDLFDVLTLKVFLVIAVFHTANRVTQPTHSILQKRFEFKKLSFAEIGFSLLSSIAAVLMAFLGFGLWAVVWPGMITMLLKGLLYWRVSKFRPKRVFDWAVVRDIKNISLAYFIFGILEEFVHKIDDIFLGKIAGTGSLGYYARAYNTSELFHVNVGGTIATVALPLFSRVQKDTGRLLRSYELVIKMVVKLGGLFYITLAVVAQEAVQLIYGQKWLPMIPILWSMLPYALLIPVLNLSKNFLISVGRIGDVTRAFIIMSIVLLIGLIPGTLWLGVIGTAISVNIMIIAGLIYVLMKIKKEIDLDIWEILYKPLVMTGIQGLLLSLIKQSIVIASSWLVILIVGGASVTLFLLSGWLVDRKWMSNDIYSFYRAVRG